MTRYNFVSSAQSNSHGESYVLAFLARGVQSGIGH